MICCDSVLQRRHVSEPLIQLGDLVRWSENRTTHNYAFSFSFVNVLSPQVRENLNLSDGLNLVRSIRLSP